MSIDEIREKLAEELSSPETCVIWIDDILYDTTPGHYGIEDLHVSVAMKDIWVDIPQRTFTFKNVDLSFSARLGGSSDKNGYDESFEIRVSGEGEFSFSGSIVEITNFSINEDLDLYENK